MGDLANTIKDDINENQIIVNGNVEDENVLPYTTFINRGTNNAIIDYYEKKNDITEINEVVLKAEFIMNDSVAMVVYRNKVGSNALRPNLSFDYNTRYNNGTETNGFNSNDGQQSGYTYMALNLTLDKDIIVPDKVFLEFKSYSWRPLYVFGVNDDGQKEFLNVLNLDGSILGNTSASFNTLVSNTNPATTFEIESNNYNNITVRVVLREGISEKITESTVSQQLDNPSQTIMEKITENMTLRFLDSSEVGVENVIKIPDEKLWSWLNQEAKLLFPWKVMLKDICLQVQGQ